MSDFTSESNIVFLIDDNFVDNFIHKKMIQLNGLSSEIKTYTSARDALNYLSEIDELNYSTSHIPFIIFLDLNMPLINGFQFMEIYERLPSIIHSRCKIVILTSSLNPADRHEAMLNKHILAFFNKPLMSEHFSELNELLYIKPVSSIIDNYTANNHQPV